MVGPARTGRAGSAGVNRLRLQGESRNMAGSGIQTGTSRAQGKAERRHIENCTAADDLGEGGRAGGEVPGDSLVGTK